ncbi:tetratricopeptide repeat protein [Sagittula stellata]|nr:hypothetical protein [Sagittula stellata]
MFRLITHALIASCFVHPALANCHSGAVGDPGQPMVEVPAGTGQAKATKNGSDNQPRLRLWPAPPESSAAVRISTLDLEDEIEQFRTETIAALMAVSAPERDRQEEIANESPSEDTGCAEVLASGDTALMRYPNLAVGVAPEIRARFRAAAMVAGVPAKLDVLGQILSVSDDPMVRHRALYEMARTHLRAGEPLDSPRLRAWIQNLQALSEQLGHELDPRLQADTDYLTAFVLLRRGQTEPALRYIDRANQRDPNFLRALYLSVEARMQSLSLANIPGAKVSRCDENSAHLLRSLRRIEALTKDRKQLIYLAEFMAELPGTAQARDYVLTALLLRIGREESARAIGNKILISPDNGDRCIALFQQATAELFETYQEAGLSAKQ